MMDKKYFVDDFIVLLESIKNKKKNIENCNVLYSVNEKQEVETIHFSFSVDIRKTK